jgi:hypothetical protein
MDQKAKAFRERCNDVRIAQTSRERPICRKVLVSLCHEYNMSIVELWEAIKTYRIHVTVDLKKQCRKMVAEHYMKPDRS